MHRREFVHIWLGNMDVQRLRLIDERTSIRCHVDDGFLRNFPHRFVQSFDVIGNTVDVLHEGKGRMNERMISRCL